MEAIANIKITGLNLKSIKSFIQLNNPLEAVIYHEEHRYTNPDTLKPAYHSEYLIRGENVWGWWYYDEVVNGEKAKHCWRSKKNLMTKADHMLVMNDERIEAILSYNGLSAFRTTLKHMDNAKTLSSIAQILPKDKKRNQHFTVEWI